MARQLEFDDGVVGNVSARLISLGGQVDDALESLLSGCDALGEPWGQDDEFARTFEATYLVSKNEVTEATANLAEFLTEMGRHIRASGQSLDSVEKS
ncbi:hypothetical protein ACFQZ4_43225 [Catellatospora coxensis]|uniref:WXG100 family type VII secretion target n=1 Tax=Catellatospora coxensis TaxID=310354 RepID=A0A8J3KUD4_9ACTN|nr:hypothetical protein [Catellatospora coxensis]GIG09252.1 hypothetical protein Cco03nite_59520 [Catellatospora coxensis]